MRPTSLVRSICRAPTSDDFGEAVAGPEPLGCECPIELRKREVGTNVNLLYNVYGRRIVGVGT